MCEFHQTPTLPEMNERPTPETDAAAVLACECSESALVVEIGVVRSFERERDEARETFARLKKVVTTDHESKEAFIARVKSILTDDQ